MERKHLIFASISMVIAVTLGALAAHTLQSVLSEKSLESFQTGVRYQTIHSLAIFAILPLVKKLALKKIILHLFKWGIILFSGSIYLLCFFPLINLEKINSYIVFLTPIGGLMLIFAWILLSIESFKK